MSEQPKKEDLITSFLDEELAEGDIDALLTALECADVRSRACRQSLASAMLNGGASCCPDISLHVRKAIAQDSPMAGAYSDSASDSVFAMKVRTRSRQILRQAWLVPAAGLALAASVAMLAVVVVKPSSNIQPASPQLAEQQQPAAMVASTPVQLTVQKVAADPGEGARELVIAAPKTSRPLTAQWHSVDVPDGAQSTQVAGRAELQQQLNAYLVNHARHGGRNAFAGSLGYARVTASPQHADESQR